MLMFSMDAYAQRNTATNLSGFDRRNYHFGFILGYNSSNFSMQRAPDFDFTDSLLAITMRPQPGFNLNLLASYDLMPNFHIRFLPGLSFQDRIMDFTFLESDLDRKTESRRIESVYLDFPINFKLRTNRSRNFAAYMLAGGKYSLDMQSAKMKDFQGNLPIHSLLKHGNSVDIGGVFRFFLRILQIVARIQEFFGDSKPPNTG